MESPVRGIKQHVVWRGLNNLQVLNLNNTITSLSDAALVELFTELKVWGIPLSFQNSHKKRTT